jgi:hypothetical protein
MGILVWCVVALALGSFVGHVIALGMDDDAPEHVAVHMSNGAIKTFEVFPMSCSTSSFDSAIELTTSG